MVLSNCSYCQEGRPGERPDLATSHHLPVYLSTHAMHTCFVHALTQEGSNPQFFNNVVTEPTVTLVVKEEDCGNLRGVNNS